MINYRDEWGFSSVLSIALIPQIVQLIIEREGLEELTAINEFYQSKVYDALAKE